MSHTHANRGGHQRRNSSPVRSPAETRPPPHSTRRPAPNGLHKGGARARERGRRRTWWHGGADARRPAGASHRNAQRGARELRGMMASTKSGPEGREEGWGGASHGEPSQAAMAPPQRKTATRASPRCERGPIRAHGLAKAEAELLADAIAKWRCVWGVRCWQTERRCAVARASARLAAAVESKCASAEGSM
jgi:hypothetical protein